MQEQDKKILDSFYQGNYKRFGNDPRSLGWNPGGQESRYPTLTAVGDLDGCSVLDVGCGFGDLYRYFKESGIRVDYTGIDLYQEFVRPARERYPEARFMVGDFENEGIEGRYDWAFSIGVFNRKIHNHDRFVENVLKRMYEVAEKGIVADFLSPKPIDLTGNLYHPEPGDILRMCRKISRKVILRWDYQPGEFCVYLYKDNEQAQGSALSNFASAVRHFDLRKGRGWG